MGWSELRCGAEPGIVISDMYLPVSYTHLDVYKRQVANRILDECYKQGIDDANITELDLTNIRPLYEELTETVAAFHEATSDSDQLMKESLSSSTPLYGLPDSLVQSVEWMLSLIHI